MFRNLSQGSQYRLWMLLTVVVLILSPVSMLLGQDAIPIEPGTVILGTVTANDTPTSYAFNGNAGDVVTIRAVGLNPGTDPNLTVFGPNQQQLAFNDNVAFAPFTTAAELVFRVQETGTHVVQVSGTQGDFILTLDVRPSVTVTTLELDTEEEVTLPVAEQAQVFAFNTDPSQITSILIDVTPSNAEVQVEVRNATGEAIATMRNNLESICLSFAPGDELHEVTILSMPDETGTVTVTLSNAPCELGQAPVEVVPAPTVQFTPVPIEGVCAASSPRNVNIRSGPGTNFSVAALLPAHQPIQVTGQNEAGTWYTVQSDLVQGWMSAAVVFVTGPCDDLPVAPAPGTATPESTAEVTPEVTEEPTVEVTVEPTVEVTEEPTVEVTVEPTVEVTEEVTETP